MIKEKFPKKIIWLNLEISKAFYEAYKKEAKRLGLDPIPEFEKRVPGILESILGSVKVKGFLLRSDIKTIAAEYFTHFVKSQAHFDGNKRMGIVYTHMFLLINGYQLNVNWNKLFQLALLVVLDNRNIKDIKKSVIPIFQKIVSPRDK